MCLSGMDHTFHLDPPPLSPIILPSLCLAVRSLGFGRAAATTAFTASAAAEIRKLYKITAETNCTVNPEKLRLQNFTN